MILYMLMRAEDIENKTCGFPGTRKLFTTEEDAIRCAKAMATSKEGIFVICEVKPVLITRREVSVYIDVVYEVDP